MQNSTIYKTFNFALNLVEEQGFPISNYYLPENKVGKFSIKHRWYKKEEILDVVNMKMAILTGAKPSKVKLDKDWMALNLFKDKQGLLMSTHPVETFTHLYPIYESWGDVLVGGLGLGYIVNEMAKNGSVDSIVVIEKEKDIIKLVEDGLMNSIDDINDDMFNDRDDEVEVTIIHDDIFNFVKRTKMKFDFMYFDIWYETEQEDFYDYVLPLRMLSRRLLTHGDSINVRKYNIICWMEEIMRGVLLIHTVATKMMNELSNKYNAVLKAGRFTKKYHRLFIDFVDEYGLEELEDMSAEEYQKLANEFVLNYKV